MSGARTAALRGAAWLLLAALLTRAWDLGNPVIHVDEQYYLLVGDRMLHGVVPYIDIWDRKPIGLFAIYAAIRLLPGDGVLAYQSVALLFAWGTAVIVRAAARRTGASPRAALAAGAAYLLWIALLGGRGGQSPVFYNLFTAAAALLTLRLPALARQGAGRAIVGNGVIACLLAGIAIQVKWTPAFEGLFVGIAHLWFIRRSGAGARVTAAVLWTAAGLLPTLAAIGWYAWMDAIHAYWFANVTSIFLRPGYPFGQLAMRLLGIAVILSAPIAAAAVAGRGAETPERRLALGWLASATVGFLAIGTFFDHYALPLVAPLLVAGAAVLDRHRRAAPGLLAVGALILLVEHVRERDDAAGARAVARVVKANSGSECPYVFIGDTITYRLADACLPTAYAFPNFLAYDTERGATGIDEAAEVARILARRPPVIVTSTRRLTIWNRASVAELKAALAGGYRPVFSAPRADYRTMVYLRRDRSLVR